MLKNKILILAIITLILSCFFGCSVYATEVNTENFNFTGFDGINYELPSFPEELKNYNHYVVLYGTDSIYLFGFNESINIVKSSSFYSVEVVCDPGFSYCYATLDCRNGIFSSSWSLYTNTGHSYVSALNGCSVIYSCPCLSSYSKELNDATTSEEGFFLNRQEILVPIMEKAPLAEVMKEILAILPVILMTIVGLIGLRKALKFLSTVLHRS